MTLPQETHNRLLLSPKEVATLIGFGRNKTYRMIRSGEIPSVRIGGRLRVPRQILDEWVQFLAQQSRGKRRARPARATLQEGPDSQ